jgi:hypothetical protein
MGKIDYVNGSSSVKEFFRFMRERHQIYVNRFVLKQPKPWSEDPIFQHWKFTNVFRELDTGTIYLRRALRHEKSPPKIIFNTIWYRLFNWYEHIENLGVLELDEFEKLKTYMGERKRFSLKIFTSAHMTHGEMGEDKVDTYVRVIGENMKFHYELADICAETNSMESAFKALLKFPMIGPFIAYEIVCDLRFSPALMPTDNMTWANVGPGAKRGLERLGMEISIQSMIDLMNKFKKEDCEISKSHFEGKYPPFELREIEHSLCEFDKYERVRLNQGNPRCKYKGY